MTETAENLMLEHLKLFQAGQDRVERKLDEVTRRLSNFEAGQASIIQHLGHLASADAQQQLSAEMGLTCDWSASNAVWSWRNSV